MSKLVNTHKTFSLPAMIVAKPDPDKGIDRMGVGFFSEAHLRQILRTNFKIGDRIWVNLISGKPKRTLRQNRYYWVYLDLIAESTGHTPEELHEALKRKHLLVKEVTVMDKVIEITKSTTDLTVGEFCEYILDIEADTGISPPPTEGWELAPMIKKPSV